MATCPAAATSIGFAAQGSIAVFWTSPINRRRARCAEKPKFPARQVSDLRRGPQKIMGFSKATCDDRHIFRAPKRGTMLGRNRSFRNISNGFGRLLVMIVPETDEQIDPISYSPSLAKEIENEYGKTALDGLQRIGFVFEDEPTG